MERFKSVEREMKTKAFSKEGLLQRERMDPKEKEKADTVDWISNTVDELSRQIEMAEAEIETMLGTTKRGKKDHAKMERIGELEHLIERDRWHINRLELILRLLENDQISTEQVTGIKEDVQYYVESNQEPDFEEDEYIYDDLNLEEEEQLYNVGKEHNTQSIEEEKPSIQLKEEEIPKPVTSINPNPNPIINSTESLTDSKPETIEDKTKVETISSVPKVVSAWTEPIKIVEQLKPVEKVLKTSVQSNDDIELVLPPSLADLASSFEMIKKRAAADQHDLQYTNHILDSSLQFVPDLIDSER
ncbi:hypothetical protein G6F35_009836 [Rhizopus arrhizus]|nr:hypothetical protein G6F35_009836 [Rhizopus arrhizus]